MGKVKIKKKSTFIDMTAMSDVTVLLLTFFMLTSTFLQKEPTIVLTPSSVSTEKVPTSNLITILVSSVDPSLAKEGKDPIDAEGKVFISFTGDQDSTWSTPKVKELILDEAVSIYNNQQALLKSKGKKANEMITLSDAQRKKFTEINMLGTSFAFLPELLNKDLSEIDKLQGDLTNPNTGIPIDASNHTYDGILNDFQIWCKAITVVAQDMHKERTDGWSEKDAKALEDLNYGLRTNGSAIAIKADKDMPFQALNVVFDNLQTMRLNKFSLMTALTSEEETAPSTSNK